MRQPLFEALVYYFGSHETGVSEVSETMHCGRSALANLEINRQGFTLSRHRSSVSDWNDLDEINRVHRSEIARSPRPSPIATTSSSTRHWREARLAG